LSPAEINLGNVPFDSDNGGVTIAHAEHTTTLSLIALRRLRFPIDGNVSGPATDDAARTVLAALALAAATMAAEKGLDLRSRCLLWPDGPAEWELLDRPGEATMKYSLDSAGVVAVLSAAVAAAEGAGIKWHADPVKLKPSDQLIALVRKSQELAAEAAGGEEGD
jgi:CRISPR-associated protein Csb1